jgi:hypothetical protein
VTSLLPPFSFISSFPHAWNSFNRYYFSIYIHVYTVFALFSSSHTLSPPPPTNIDHPGKTCSTLLFSDFVKEKEKTDICACLGNNTGSFLVALPCIYVKS